MTKVKQPFANDRQSRRREIVARIILASRRLNRIAILLAAVAIAQGCGPKTDRLSLSGDVTLNGAPLDNGSIRFSSTGDGSLQSTGAVIVDGAFVIPVEKGLLPGKYRVEINSPDDHAKPVRVAAYPGGPTMEVPADRIPAAYNIDSDKSVEVDRDSDNHFDFDVVASGK